jgi:hypothetical protein
MQYVSASRPEDKLAKQQNSIPHQQEKFHDGN